MFLPPLQENLNHSCLKYMVFVTGLVCPVSLIFVAVPLLLSGSYRQCTRCSNITLEIQSGMNRTADPCQDLYQFVCGNWNHANPGYASPQTKHTSHVAQSVLRFLLTRRLVGAGKKVADILARCFRPRDEVDQLRAFLRKHQLSWPSYSDPGPPQVYDILAGMSLGDGLPVLLWFTIAQNLENRKEPTVFLSFDSQFPIWINHIRRLTERNKVRTFLRRCAEIVGEMGYSYRRMIEDVLRVHELVLSSSQVRLNAHDHESYYYIEMINFDLRNAVNRHLPNHMQLWPEDTMAAVVPPGAMAIVELVGNRTLSSKLKLYLGAYVVWYLMPFASPYLTASLMEDMGSAEHFQSYLLDRCFDFTSFIMPLVAWKVIVELITREAIELGWSVFETAKKELVQAATNLSSADGRLLERTLKAVTLHPLNDANTWQSLDVMYVFIPELHGSFFSGYLRLAKSAVDFLKWLNFTKNNNHNLPGVYDNELYHLLTFGHVRPLWHYFLPPFLHPSLPTEVSFSYFGVRVALELNLYSTYKVPVRYNRDGHLASPLVSLNMTRCLEGMIVASSDIHAPAPVQRNNVAHIVANSIMHAALLAKGFDLSQPSAALPEFTREQAFFVSSCFMSCAGLLVTSSSINQCNVPAKLSHSFANAFGCGNPEHEYLDRVCPFLFPARK